MSPKPGFRQFWESRGDGYTTAANRWATSHTAAVVAYLCARLGLTPNQVTLLSLVFGMTGFLLAFGLPVDRPVVAIAAIVIVAELTLVLDCADGLLARVTDRVARHGELIDHTLDVASQACALSAVFIYAYRTELSQQEPALANGFLVVGFLFFVARTTRHIGIHLSQCLFGRTPTGPQIGKMALSGLLTNLLEFQASMIAAASYLVSPLFCLALFAAQGLLCAAAVARRMFWAMNLE